MKTRKGIYLNLDETEYFYRVGDYKFYFSSRLYRDKFIKRYSDYRLGEKVRFAMKYKLILNNSDIFLFALYNSIEKRGFRVDRVNKRGYQLKIYKSLPSVNLELV